MNAIDFQNRTTNTVALRSLGEHKKSDGLSAVNAFTSIRSLASIYSQNVLLDVLDGASATGVAR